MNKHGSMNRFYRLVWNATRGAWVPAAETARGHRRHGGGTRRSAAAVLAALGLGTLPALAGNAPTPAPVSNELPTGGHVVAGNATISANSTADAAILNIDQSTQRAVIDWQTFNVGSAAEVNFNQPNSSAATLNRVLDSNASQIFGRIHATGQVFLVNPNGVYFGKSATVDVGALAATTGSISNEDFMAGNLVFKRNGATGSVVNEGELRAAIGGYIALLAPEVRNSGVVIARLGTVALASGDAFTLKFDDDHLTGITIQPATMKSLVENRGAVLAPGGLIILSAQAYDRVQGGVVNNSGTVEATGLAMRGGRILLEASGSVINSGTVNANAGADGSPAGSIAIDAPNIENSGVIEAASMAVPVAAGSASAGGSITLSATTISQSASGVLDTSGFNGGRIALEAAQDISLQGTVTAAANAVASPAIDVAGHGGSIEITGGHDVTLQDARVDATGDAGGGQIAIRGGGQDPDLPLPDQPTVALLGATRVRTSSRRGRGGDITLTGDRLGLFGDSAIDASGATGGGNVMLGGGFHGEDPSIANASQVVIGSGAGIDASATQRGDGGRVAVWSDDQTTFAGNIAARGGSTGGAGGFVEVSGKGSLGFSGMVDASALHGAAGTLLLDPRNITVDAGGTALTTDVDQFADTPAGDSIITPSTIAAIANAGTAVTLQANNDITINSSIVSNNPSGNGGALTFQAGRNITVNASIYSDSGDISFTANDAGASGANRTAGNASFTNNSLIDAGGGTVNITLGTQGNSGTISTGQITANTLVITHNGPTAGATTGQIDLGELNVTNNLTITANSARNVVNSVGNVVVRGTASINVGSGDVNVTRATTDFSIISLTAGNATLADTNAVQFGTTTLSGNLVESTVGPIGSTGAVQVGGTTNLTTTSGGFGYADPYINLTNASNHFTGLVTLSVPAAGTTGTGGYATIRDSGAINLTASNTAGSLAVQSGGAATLGSITAGSSVAVTSASGAVNLDTTHAGSSVSISAAGTVNLLATTAGTSLSINTTGAVDLGTTTLGNDLNITTSGAITDSGTLTVPGQTNLTAGSANNITFDSANNNFNGVRVVSGKDVTLVDTNGINFGSYQGGGGYTSHIYGALNVTAGGDIGQINSSYNDGYSQITVDGATTFTANNASAQISLYVGPDDPFNGYGQSNTFTGGITLARNNTNTGFSNVEVRNISASASALTGLTSVGALSNVSLRYDNAPSITLPGMALSGSLKVYAPSVGQYRDRSGEHHFADGRHHRGRLDRHGGRFHRRHRAHQRGATTSTSSVLPTRCA